VIEQQPVQAFSPRPIQVFFSGCGDQIRRFNGGKTVCGAGPAEQTGEKRLLKILRPGKTALDERPQQSYSAARNSCLLPRGPENGTGHLAKSAPVTSGNLVIKS
jgi:hypothetical protein